MNMNFNFMHDLSDVNVDEAEESPVRTGGASLSTGLPSHRQTVLTLYFFFVSLQRFISFKGFCRNTVELPETRTAFTCLSIECKPHCEVTRWFVGHRFETSALQPLLSCFVLF